MEFRDGEYFIYKNGNSYEIGKVKRKCDDKSYFCYYHLGNTAAKTPVENMIKIKNEYIFHENVDLGGLE